jgi:hypothetical protein
MPGPGGPGVPAWNPSACDQFLHDFKGTACGRASRARPCLAAESSSQRTVPREERDQRRSGRSERECRGYCPAPGVAVLPAASALGERPARATAARPIRPAPGRCHVITATPPARSAASCTGAGGLSSSRAAIVSPCKITVQGHYGPRPPRRLLRNRRPLSSDLPRRASAPIARMGAEPSNCAPYVP